MEVDELCDELESSKLFKDSEQEWEDLTFSTRMGFMLLSKSNLWISGSVSRYKKYLRYVNFNLTEDALVVHNLINEYINTPADEMYNDLPLFAAKVISIDKLIINLVEISEQLFETQTSDIDDSF